MFPVLNLVQAGIRVSVLNLVHILKAVFYVRPDVSEICCTNVVISPKVARAGDTFLLININRES